MCCFHSYLTVKEAESLRASGTCLRSLSQQVWESLHAQASLTAGPVLSATLHHLLLPAAQASSLMGS